MRTSIVLFLSAALSTMAIPVMTLPVQQLYGRGRGGSELTSREVERSASHYARDIAGDVASQAISRRSVEELEPRLFLGALFKVAKVAAKKIGKVVHHKGAHKVAQGAASLNSGSSQHRRRELEDLYERGFYEYDYN